MNSDFLRLALDEEGREVLATIPYEGEWPPPEYVEVGGGIGWRRVSASSLPPGMKNVARGALYVFQAMPFEAAEGEN